MPRKLYAFRIVSSQLTVGSPQFSGLHGFREEPAVIRLGPDQVGRLVLDPDEGLEVLHDKYHWGNTSSRGDRTEDLCRGFIGQDYTKTPLFLWVIMETNEIRHMRNLLRPVQEDDHG